MRQKKTVTLERRLSYAELDTHGRKNKHPDITSLDRIKQDQEGSKGISLIRTTLLNYSLCADFNSRGPAGKLAVNHKTLKHTIRQLFFFAVKKHRPTNWIPGFSGISTLESFPVVISHRSLSRYKHLSVLQRVVWFFLSEKVRTSVKSDEEVQASDQVPSLWKFLGKCTTTRRP